MIGDQQNRVLQLRRNSDHTGRWQQITLLQYCERIHNLSPQIQSITLANFILATNNLVYCKPMKRFPKRFFQPGVFSILRQVPITITNSLIESPLSQPFYCTVETKSMQINSRCLFPLPMKNKIKSEATRSK